MITLVKGHGWAYNGKSAWRSVAERWAKETSQWVGSNYHCFSCKITFAFVIDFLKRRKPQEFYDHIHENSSL
jgi:hypothetical protein